MIWRNYVTVTLCIKSLLWRGVCATMRWQNSERSSLAITKAGENIVWFFWTHVHVRYMLSPFRLSSVCRRSVVCLFVTLVHPQAVEIFGNISMAFGTLAIHWHPHKILRRSFQENPSAGGVKHKRDSILTYLLTYLGKYSDFGSIEGYISETVQDRR